MTRRIVNQTPAPLPDEPIRYCRFCGGPVATWVTKVRMPGETAPEIPVMRDIEPVCVYRCAKGR